MNEYDVKRFALALSIQAEIEGMKAHNEEAKTNGREPYHDVDFQNKAEELRNLAAKHDEQL